MIKKRKEVKKLAVPKYKLLFSKEKEEFGRFLKLFKFGSPIAKWPARSGQRDWQESYWDTGLSPIPPSSETDMNYEVQLEPEYVPVEKQAAMGEWFYPVLPRIIVSKDGNHVRGYIGIHEDANADYAPGSAGCVVMLKKDFDDFHKEMQAIQAQENCETLPLEVVYY